MDTPKISIIIPVYNTEQYLRQCLDSTLAQTLQQIEVICVDDGSRDRSADILTEYQQKNSHVKTAFFEQSRSAMEARRTGVQMAEGEYILFLDADDYLEPDACEALYQKACEENVDILQFSSQVENCADIPEERIQQNQRLLEPLARRLSGTDIFTECFVNRNYGFTLWNKLMRTSLCKRAFSEIEGGYLPKAQDLYTYFSIAYFAQSYLGWKSKYYHHYCLGRGVTANAALTLDQFRRYCMQAKVVDALKAFCRKQAITDIDTAEIIERFEQQWIRESVDMWLRLSTSENAEAAVNVLFELWGAERVVPAVSDKYWYSRDLIADRLGQIPGSDLTDKKIRTVAIYYYRYNTGGVQRVLSLLEPLLQNMGLRVVLITDEEPTENDLKPIDGVPRLIIQSYKTTNRSNYALRMHDWKKIIEKWNIDLVLYNAWTSNLLLWDMMYLKNNDVSVIVQTHSVCTYALMNLGKDFGERPKILALADGIVTLSEADRVFWSAYNKRVWHLPNPVDPGLKEVVKTDGSQPIITWIGRFSNEKRPWEALRIMKLVAQQNPEAMLYVIGDSAEKSILGRYRKMAEDLGIENQVQFFGYQSDVSPFLQKAAVNLITSTYEGYSMVLVEAQAHGVPTVMYDMPYLDLCRDDLGVVCVTPDDRSGAARELTELLHDRARWNTYHERSVQSFKTLAEYDFPSQWENVLNGVCPQYPANASEVELIHTIVNHYLIGWTYTQTSSANGLRLSPGAGSDAVSQICSSWSYRIGRFITFIPRKIRGGIRCYQEHGWSYTWHRVLVHLRIQPDDE